MQTIHFDWKYYIKNQGIKPNEFSRFTTYNPWIWILCTVSLIKHTPYDVELRLPKLKISASNVSMEVNPKICLFYEKPFFLCKNRYFSEDMPHKLTQIELQKCILCTRFKNNIFRNIFRNAMWTWTVKCLSTDRNLKL